MLTKVAALSFNFERVEVIFESLINYFLEVKGMNWQKFDLFLFFSPQKQEKASFTLVTLKNLDAINWIAK